MSPDMVCDHPDLAKVKLYISLHHIMTLHKLQGHVASNEMRG